MKNNYVNKMIFKNNAVFLIIILTVTLSVVCFLKPVYKNIYNYFCGPFEMKPENLLSISELKDEGGFIEKPLQNNYYINGNKFYYRITGYEPIKTRVRYTVNTYTDNSQTVVKNIYEYLLLKIEERYLLVRVPLNNSSATKFSGMILPLTPALKHEIKLHSEVLSNDEDLLPFIFDATGNFEKNVYYQLAITITLFAILIFFNYKIIIRIMNPKKHPLYKKLSIYGAPEEIAESITREVMDDYTYEDGKYLRTYNWNIKRSLFRPDITSNYRTNK